MPADEILVNTPSYQVESAKKCRERETCNYTVQNKRNILFSSSFVSENSFKAQINVCNACFRRKYPNKQLYTKNVVPRTPLGTTKQPRNTRRGRCLVSILLTGKYFEVFPIDSGTILNC